MPTAKLSGLVTRLGRRARRGAARPPTANCSAVRRHPRRGRVRRTRPPSRAARVRRVPPGDRQPPPRRGRVPGRVRRARGEGRRDPPAAAVAAWLHGVACRTALRARTMADRRRRRETLVGTLPEASAPSARGDTRRGRDPRRGDRPAAGPLPRGGGAVRTRGAAARTRQGGSGSRGDALQPARGRPQGARGPAASAGVVLSAAGCRPCSARRRGRPPAALAARAMAATTPEPSRPPWAPSRTECFRIMFLDKLKTTPARRGLARPGACAALAAAPNRRADPAPKPHPRRSCSSGRRARAGEGRTEAAAEGAEQAPPLPRPGSCRDRPGRQEREGSCEDSKLYHPSGAMLSPDGKQVAGWFPVRCRPTTARPPPSGAPRRSTSAGSTKRNRNEPRVEGQVFAWSPDGTEIACATSRTDGEEEPARPTSS